MKKTLLLASLLAVALSACGKNEETAPADTMPPAATTPGTLVIVAKPFRPLRVTM